MDRLLLMEAFVRVVEAGSFSEAARRWGRSKAAVSKYISALEAHLGVELLHRTTRALRLTEAGARYHPKCVAMLETLEVMEADLRQDHVAPRGVLRITAPPGFVQRYQAMMLSQFTARYPQIELDLYLTYRRVDIINEGFDVAIRVTNPKDSSLMARRLAPADMCMVAAPSYLALAGTPARPEDLRDHACLIDTNFRQPGTWRFNVDGRQVSVPVTGPIKINSPTVVRDLAISGHGVAVVSRFLVADALATGRLISILDGTVDFGWSVYALYPKRQYVAGRVRAFVDHMAAGLRQG